jgi:hypothetical protein
MFIGSVIASLTNACHLHFIKRALVITRYMTRLISSCYRYVAKLTYQTYSVISLRMTNRYKLMSSNISRWWSHKAPLIISLLHRVWNALVHVNDKCNDIIGGYVEIMAPKINSIIKRVNGYAINVEARLYRCYHYMKAQLWPKLRAHIISLYKWLISTLTFYSDSCHKRYEAFKNVINPYWRSLIVSPLDRFRLWIYERYIQIQLYNDRQWRIYVAPYCAKYYRVLAYVNQRLQPLFNRIKNILDGVRSVIQFIYHLPTRYDNSVFPCFLIC